MLDFFVNYPVWAILGVVLLGVGGALLFVGTVVTLALAFSDGRAWGFAVLLIPGFQYFYCFSHWSKAAYSGKLLIAALVFLSPVISVVMLNLYGFLGTK